MFYVGSTSNMESRKRDHLWRLKKGIHPNPMLQAAFVKFGEIRCCHLQKIDDGDPDEVRKNLRAAEQEYLNLLFGTTGCCNRSPNALGPNNTEWFTNKWKNPEYREKMTAFLKARKGAVVSKETREKMSLAKCGAKNPKSKPVEFLAWHWREQSAVITQFESSRAASIHFGFNNTTMLSMMNGVQPRHYMNKFDFFCRYAWRFQGSPTWLFFRGELYGLKEFLDGGSQPPPP